MAATDVQTLRELARLARLALTEEDLARLAPELGRILAAFEVLGRHVSPAASEPDPAAPTCRAGASVTRARGDEPLPSLPRDVLLAAASASADGFFVVPKTVGSEP